MCDATRKLTGGRAVVLLFTSLVAPPVPVLEARPVSVTPYPPEWPHRAPWKLNRELLLPETTRIVFVVDSPRGAAPKPEALDHLVSLAAKHGVRPASWVRLGELAAPDVRWVTSEQPRRLADVSVHLHDGASVENYHLSQDVIDSIHYFNEAPACGGILPLDTSYVFVRYLGDWIGAYGSTYSVTADASCGARTFPVMCIAQGRIALDRPPGIGQVFLEQRALAHEYGHVLGLATNPAHGFWYSTLPYRGGTHCVHRECAVSVPTAMALLKGQMLDYCADCIRDIEQARDHWITGKDFSEVRRLAQPDSAAYVARLKKHNFREAGEADRLVARGKAVMPALMKRLPDLPGGSFLSPRSYAARLALKIVVLEDQLRREELGPVLALPSQTEDLSGPVLAWWWKESERFMHGDDWELPVALRAQPAAHP